jgi:ribosome-associated protein
MHEELLKLTLTVLDDMKAKAVSSMDVSSITSISDYMIFATGNSSRHVRSIADKVTETVKKEDHSVVGIEGYETSKWVLIDLGDVIVHIMQEETRSFYKLEDLWSVGDQIVRPRL